MKQLHNLKVMEPRNLSNNDKKAAADYLMFLKEKRDKTIKARGCFDGRKQRATISKEESSSPTVATESVFITSAIEAHEGRDVAVVDLPGAFMQANQEDLVHMKLKGTLAKVLIMLDPQCYRKYVVQENGVPTLYVELQKALYGQLKAALLFWKKLTKVLVIGLQDQPLRLVCCKRHHKQQAMHNMLACGRFENIAHGP